MEIENNQIGYYGINNDRYKRRNVFHFTKIFGDFNFR